MERKNKGLVVAVVILIILVLALGGYLAYDKLLTSNTDTKEEDKVEKYDNTKAKELLEKFEVLDVYLGGTSLERGYDDNFKSYIVLKNLESKAQKDTCKSLLEDDIEVGNVEYEKNERAYLTSGGYCKDKSFFINYDDANALYKEMFGNFTGSMPMENVDFATNFYYYSLEKNGFIQTYRNTGGVNPAIYISEFKDATIKDDILTIEVYHNMLEPEDSNGNIVFTFNGKTWDAETDTKTIEKEVLQEKEKMDVYKIIFIKENDHFTFDRIMK